MDIPYTKNVLPNGLQVIVHEDRRCPIVAVNIWYNVGSKNEQPGRTGFAHLFEHLMFEGSEHHDHSYFEPLQQAGALLNGSTSADRTNYWEVVPSNALDLALWMESDRMGYLLPALTAAKFDNQRDVVLNERRQNYENRPYGMVPFALLGALYPREHPYHWPTIGAARDLEKATIEDAVGFFRRFYHPGNASLVIAGDVDAPVAFEKTERSFGQIPSGPGNEPGHRAEKTANLGSDVLLHLADRIELPRLYLAWHSPALFAENDADLDLAAAILGVGKNSRLYRSLVYRDRLATEVTAVQNSRELGSFFQVAATAAPGRTAGEVDAAVAAEIEELASGGPTAEELERAKAQVEAEFVFGLQTVGGFGGRADQLNSYNVHLGNPGSFEWDLTRYRTSTAERVRDAVAATLANARSVRLAVVPEGRHDLGLPAWQPAEVS